MTKVVLVYPPMVFGKKRNFGFPPLGALYIATFLQNKKIDVKVIDSFINGYTLKQLKQIILEEKPDIVGFSAMTCQVNATLDIVESLRRDNHSLRIVVGGSHVSSTKEELFQFTKNIDFLIYGEGENSFYRLVNALEKKEPFEGIEGLIYKSDTITIINNPPQPISDLDELTFPDFRLLNVHDYDSYYAQSLPLATLIASRGCPFSCNFCDAYATHGKVLRLRSPKNIVDEIEYNYKEHYIKQVMIKDSTFTINREWVLEICSEIKKRDFKIDWTCNTRVDLIDEELLRNMKESGCYMAMFGIESGSQRVLDTIGKGITVEQIKRGIALCKKNKYSNSGIFYNWKSGGN